MNPKLEISGGGSIFDILAFESYFGGLDQFNQQRKRYEAFFVYNRATVQGNLQKDWLRKVQTRMSEHCCRQYPKREGLEIFGIVYCLSL